MSRSATKRPLSAADRLPRGGGALLAEVDGNYIAWPAGEDGQSRHFELSWTGKFRGRFEPLVYRTEVASCDGLRDENGDPLNSVWGSRAGYAEVERCAKAQVQDDDAVLAVMSEFPGKTLREWAERLGWMIPSGANGKRVQRALERLSEGKGKLAAKERGAYMLTSRGKQAAADLHANGGFPAFYPTATELAEGLLQGNAICVLTGREAAIQGPNRATNVPQRTPERPCHRAMPQPPQPATEKWKRSMIFRPLLAVAEKELVSQHTDRAACGVAPLLLRGCPLPQRHSLRLQNERQAAR